MYGRIDFFSVTRTLRGTHEEGVRWPASPVVGGQLSGEALRHLARSHEYDHLVTLLSTPLGLLLWRIESTHIIDATWFAARLDEAGVDAAPGGVHRWFLAPANRRQFIAAAKAGRLSPHKPPRTPSDAISAADRYLEGLAAARSLHDHIFGRFVQEHARVADFLRVANIGHRYLAERSDLRPVHWVSRNDPSTPLHGAIRVNGRHILEAMAREYELDILKLHGVPAEVSDQWERRMLAGVYRPVAELLRGAGLRGIPARNLCSAALSGRLDPATVTAQAELLYIEDELPWFRLARLLNAFKREGFKPDDLRSRPKVKQLCIAAGVMPPSEVFKVAAVQPLLGDGANWDPLNRSGLLSGDVSPATWPGLIEDARMDLPRWFGRSFRAQAKAEETGRLVSPDIPRAPVVYDDSATITPQTEIDESGVARELARWCARNIAEYALAFIQGNPVTNPSTMARKIDLGLRLAGFDADFARKMVHGLFLRHFQGGGAPNFLLYGMPNIIMKSLTFIRDDHPAA